MKFNVKNLFMGVVLIIVLAVVFLRGDQLVELGETMKQGSPLPLVAAILTQLGKYFAQSFAYSRSFAAVGERMEPKSTLPLVFGTFFMNTIAPSMNLAGTTLVVDDARRRGIPAGKATGAALLMQITIDGAAWWYCAWWEPWWRCLSWRTKSPICLCAFCGRSNA